MNLWVNLLTLIVGIFHFKIEVEGKTGWSNIITSKHYWNTKLAMETENTIPAQNISTVFSEASARMICAKKCANMQICLGFNFYFKNNQYTCEYLPENFCSNRQRIALQAWPGGTVWDKLSSGMTNACIEQKFNSTTNARYCDTGRYGCRDNWPNCETCVKTCRDCKSTYNGTSGLYNCTLWPEGHFQTPIFGYCNNTATFVVKRNVNKYTGRDLSSFNATDGTKYSSTYINFAVDSKGSLMNMTYKSGNGLDGFQLGGKPLKPSPFVVVPGRVWGNCGSFWFFNSSKASVNCPGGEVGMFGEFQDSSWSWDRSWYLVANYGIRWPKAKTDGKILIYADIKFDI